MNRIFRLGFQVLGIALALVLLGALGYGLFLLFDWLVGALTSVVGGLPTVTLVAALTVLTAVTIIVLGHRRTKEREWTERHRPQRIEVYQRLMHVMTELLHQVSTETRHGVSHDVVADNPIDSLFDFTRDIVAWGAPQVINSYHRLRILIHEGDNIDILVASDELLRAIRKDLGKSNRGLAQGDLIKLFLNDPNVLTMPLNEITAQDTASAILNGTKGHTAHR